MQTAYDYLIIGNSTSAVGAVEAIRGAGDQSSIGIIAHESEHTYSRPLITYFVSGKVEEKNIYYRPLNFYEKNNVDVTTGKTVVAVDDVNKQVILDDDTKVGFTKLLIAAGGGPVKPPVPGIDRPGVFFMNTMDDARKAKGWLSHTKKAVVIGGGLTGLKTAEALAYLGKDVTVVEMANRVLAINLDETASELVRESLIEHGVEILTGVQVTGIEGSEDSNDVSSVALNTGEYIACETVFVAVGVKPRLEIVKSSSISTNRGILVDRYMKTNIEGIYAAGDIAEAYDPVTGSNKVLPILPNAYVGGRVAGLNMTGKSATYNIGMSVNSVSFFGEPFMSAGLATQPEDDGYKVYNSQNGKSYRRLVVKDGKLVGLIVTGDVERAGLMTGIIRAGVNVDGMIDDVLTGHIGLINLPKEIVIERLQGTGRNWA